MGDTLNRSRWTPKAAALVTLALAAGCATPTLRLNAFVVPEWDEAARLRRVAVQPFAGARGPETAALVRQALAEARFSGAPYFVVVPFTPSPSVLAAGPAQLGVELGVDAVWTGTVKLAAAAGESRIDTRCGELDKDGRCKRSVDFRCHWISATFTVEAEVHAVSTGRRIHAGTVVGESRTEEECAEAPGYLGRLVSHVVEGAVDTVTGAREAQVREAQAAFVERIVAAATPGLELIEVPLLEAGRGVPKPLRDKIEDALGAVKRGASAGAFCAAIEETRPHAAADPALAYDLGVCAEYAGRFEEARALYERAEAGRASERRYEIAGLGRVRRALAGIAILGGAPGAEPGRP